MTRASHAVAASAAVLLVLGGCATNAATGRHELVLESDAQEVALGRHTASDLVKGIGLYPDPAVQAYVARVGAVVAATTERRDLSWTFQVVDDPAVNAFAFPGGFVFVTRGLLAHIENEAQLAVVLGHEAAHVAAKHDGAPMTPGGIDSLGIGGAMMLSGNLAKYDDPARAGSRSLLRAFSPGDEAEADLLGLRYARAAGYDVRQSLPLYDALAVIGLRSAGTRLPDWLATQGDPAARGAAARVWLDAAAPAQARERVGREPYLRMVNGLAFGEDPRHGYFAGTEFFHPALRFRLRFPDGWGTHVGNDVISAVSPAGDATVEIRIIPGGRVAAWSDFMRQRGVHGAVVSSEALHGLQATTSEIEAESQLSLVRGVVAFVEYAGRSYRILGYGPAEKFEQYAPQFRAAILSFGKLGDRRALGVRPARIHLSSAPRAMTLARFNVEYPSSVSLDELAVVNGLDPAAVLQAGQVIKRVLK